MIDIVRVFADWAEDATYGVNALLASVPRDGDVALPPNVTVMDETRDESVAFGMAPKGITATTPVLLYSLSDGLQQQYPSAQPFPDFTAELIVRYAVSQSVGATGVAAALVTMRAVWRNIALLGREQSANARVRNSTQVLSFENMRFSQLYTALDDRAVLAGLALTVRCRDLYANA